MLCIAILYNDIKTRILLNSQVNQTVDSLVSERTQHQTELSQLRIEMDNQLQIRGQLEAEVSSLQQMVKQLQQQQVSHSRST